MKKLLLVFLALTLALMSCRRADAEAVHVKVPWVERVSSDGCYNDSPYTAPHLLFKGYDGLFYLTETITLINSSGHIASQVTTVTAYLTRDSQIFPFDFPGGGLTDGWEQVSTNSAQKTFAPRPQASFCPIDNHHRKR